MEENSKVLILYGEPIDETIVVYGPFVMNTIKRSVGGFSIFPGRADGQFSFVVNCHQKE